MYVSDSISFVVLVVDTVVVNSYHQWRRGRGHLRICPPPKFWVVGIGKLSETFLLVGKFSFKNAKFGAENPHFVKI